MRLAVLRPTPQCMRFSRVVTIRSPPKPSFLRASGVRGRMLGGPNAILLKIFFKERGTTARNVLAMKGMPGGAAANARTPQNGAADTSVRYCLPPSKGKLTHNRQIKLTKKVKCMYEVEKGVAEDAPGAWGGTWP